MVFALMARHICLPASNAKSAEQMNIILGLPAPFTFFANVEILNAQRENVGI
jgi:hypothetical protein